MLLAASQRLWTPAEERAVLPLLPHCGVDGVAPLARRLWPVGCGREDAVRVAQIWAAGVRQMGLEVPALLDGVDGRDGALLGAGAVALFSRLNAVIDLAGVVGIPVVVLGAPALRRGPFFAPGTPEGDLLVSRLRASAIVAETAGVVLGIKPVCASSGAQFWTSADAVQETCDAVESPALRVVLDSAALARDGAPRARLAAYVGRAPVFVASESFGGVIAPRADGMHQTCAADLARFAHLSRAPDWIVWEGDGPDVMRQAGPVLRQQAHGVRTLYAPALQAPPLRGRL